MKRLVIAAVAASITLVGGNALACLHRMKVQQDPETKMLVKAEKDVHKGAYKKAMKAVNGVFPKLASESVPTSTKKTAGKLRRALTVAAIVSVRTGGALGPNGKMLKKRKAQAANLKWAVNTLSKLSKSRTYDNKLKARHAEALARVGNLAQAQAILDGLANKDLMPDAQSYATLAALKAANGDAKGRDNAVKLCKMRSSKRGVCELPKLAQGTATKTGPNVM